MQKLHSTFFQYSASESARWRASTSEWKYTRNFLSHIYIHSCVIVACFSHGKHRNTHTGRSFFSDSSLSPSESESLLPFDRVRKDIEFVFFAPWFCQSFTIGFPILSESFPYSLILDSLLFSFLPLFFLFLCAPITINTEVGQIKINVRSL